MDSSNQPLVSIIMNCYNGEKYLKEAIDSIYAQTYPHWEIIFWDNRSDDNSAEIAQSYDERLRYFRANKKTSLGKARNLALKHIKGDFVAILDVDDLWLPDKLKQQIDYFEKNPDVILCYTNFCTLYDNPNEKNRLTYNKNTLYNGEIFSYLIHFHRPFLNLQSVLINRKLTQSELYFEHQYTYVEDYELFYRLSLIGKFGYVDEYLIHYRVHTQNMTFKFDVSAFQRRLKENEALLKQFNHAIQKYKVDTFPIYAYIYGVVVFEFLKNNQFQEAKKYAPKLRKYHTLTNMGLLILMKTRVYPILKVVSYRRIAWVRNLFQKLKNVICLKF